MPLLVEYGDGSRECSTNMYTTRIIVTLVSFTRRSYPSGGKTRAGTVRPNSAYTKRQRRLQRMATLVFSDVSWLVRPPLSDVYVLRPGNSQKKQQF